MLFAEGKAVAEEEDEENEGGEGGDEGEEEESDMELAWKMLETARLIHEKQPGHTVEEADVITTLADISTERGRMTPLREVLGRSI
jgi:HAT1-interacting factor 1